MSDQDNLRDRLKSRICQQTGCHIDDAEIAAQAIIDELGLQVLEVDRIDLINGTVASCQIIGKWEKQ